jgi:hypothetical protein
MLTPLPVSACTASVSPAQSHSAPPLPPVRGSPALRVPYGRVRLPPSHRLPSEWFFRLAYSAHMRPRRRWISQVPDASVSGRAVLLDPAAVSGGHSHSDRLLLPSRYSTLSACGCRLTRLNRFTSRYSPSVALPTLSSCRYLHKPKARFPVRWLFLLPVRESHPLEAPSFAWRTKVSGREIVEQHLEADVE